MPYKLGISDTELITLFGNLLDNAVEACEKLETGEKYIRLKAAAEGGCLAVYMENSAPAVQQRSERRIRGLERGLGLVILKELAARYNGSLSTELSKDGSYITDIILQTEGNTV